MQHSKYETKRRRKNLFICNMYSCTVHCTTKQITAIFHAHRVSEWRQQTKPFGPQYVFFSVQLPAGLCVCVCIALTAAFTRRVMHWQIVTTDMSAATPPFSLFQPHPTGLWPPSFPSNQRGLFKVQIEHSNICNIYCHFCLEENQNHFIFFSQSIRILCVSLFRLHSTNGCRLASDYSDCCNM